MIEEISFRENIKFDDRSREFANIIGRAIVKEIKQGDTYNEICHGLVQILAVNTLRVRDDNFYLIVAEGYKDYVRQLKEKV